MAAPAAPALNAYINRSRIAARAFHHGRGLVAPGSRQHPLESPLEGVNIAGAVRPTAAELRAHWDSTEEATFFHLFNAAVVAYERQSLPPGVIAPRTPLLVPAINKRASASFQGFEALNTAFSGLLSLASKITRLQAIDAQANAHAAELASAHAPGKKAAKATKRAKGQRSKRSGRYGKDQYGSNKRSPHEPAAVRASPVPGANIPLLLRSHRISSSSASEQRA